MIHRLCAVEELEDGQKTVNIEGIADPLLVVLRGAELFVVDGLCPHQYAPLQGGEIDRECILTCSHHGWRFDLRTGKSPDIPILSIQRWRAHLADGAIWLDGDQALSPAEGEK